MCTHTRGLRPFEEEGKHRFVLDGPPVELSADLAVPLGMALLVLTALDMGAPLSVVAPTREMSMMVGALLGMIILREPVGVWRLVGCVVLIAGVVLLGAM